MSPIDCDKPLDLGSGVVLQWSVGDPSGLPTGGILSHPSPHIESGRCEGGIMFDTPYTRARYTETKARWQVQSWEPLTISPSVECTADGHSFHGHIVMGKWVPA